jgi:phosphatidylglycerophosphate synthase
MQDPKPPTGTDRRPLTSRSIPIFRGITHLLVRLNVRPNTISVASIVFGVLAGAALFLTSSEWAGPGAVRGLVFTAAVCIQLRLICNMLDGMVAIEGKTSSAVGELYNEVPDRISDAATIIGAGYALGGWVVGGYVAAILAVLTAYVRALGKAAGAGSEFCGPMAKPHRMALLTVVCLLLTVAPGSMVPHALIGEADRGLFALAVAIIAAGSALTCIRRLLRISRTLRGHQATKPVP